MRVHGYSCPECGFYHDHTNAAPQESGLKIKCADCGWVETIEPESENGLEVRQ